MPVLHVNSKTGGSLPESAGRVAVGNCIELLFLCAKAADAFYRSYEEKNPALTEQAFEELARTLLQRGGAQIRNDARVMAAMCGAEVIDLTDVSSQEAH